MKGPIVFASDDSADAMVDAKAFISEYNLTMNDVSLVVKNGQTLIYAKRNFFLDHK